MAEGLDLFETQNKILEYLTSRVPALYEVHEGDIADAATRQYINGVNQTTLVVQFGDLLPSARDKSFCGPGMDGYYSLFRVLCLASEPGLARQANSIVNQVLIGFRGENIGSIHKEGGGGSFAIGEAQTRPIAYGLMSSYRFLTNIASPGSTVALPTP